VRLARVERGRGVKNRLILAVIRLTTHRRAPDVVRTLLYRPEIFGRQFNRWLQSVIRGGELWTIWERELFAAFTSHLNRCPF
jgi:hypothetical protein